MASAKRESKATIDPAELAKLIPVEGDDDEPTVATLGDDAPPLLRHEPMPPPPAQSPIQKRRVSATAPAAPVQPRKDIARMLPSSHRVYVYKKKDDGKQVFVNEYTAQELQGAGTIEAFIKKYVVPHYEHGEYHVHYFDGQSKEPTPLGIVNIEAPVDYVSPNKVNGNGRQPSMTESMREVMAIQKELQQQALQSQQPPKKSAAEEAMELMMTSMLKKQMESLNSGEQQKDGGMGMLMTMMLMERMKPAAPAVDPAIQRLMEKMMDRIEAMEQEIRVSQAMVPPPLPPVHEGPSHVEVLIEAMRENSKMMIETMRAQQQQRDPIKDFADMAALMAPKASESLTTKDLFEIMPKFQAMFAPKEQSSDPFKQTVDNFRLFKMMQREFEGPPVAQTQSQQDSFWTFARDMIRSDIGKGIAAQIMQQAAGQDIANQGRQRSSQQAQEARAIAQRRAEHAARQRQQAEMVAQQAAERARAVAAAEEAAKTQPVTLVPDPALPQASSAVSLNDAMPQQQAAQPVPVPPPPAPPPPPVQTQHESEPEQEEEEETNEVSVPDNFISHHAPLINDAPNDAKRIEAIIEGLQALAASKDFYPVIAKMFGLCKQNRKAEALDHLAEILEFFSDNELLRPDLPALARADFDKHWKIIRSQMGFEETPEVAPNGSAQAQA